MRRLLYWGMIISCGAQAVPVHQVHFERLHIGGEKLTITTIRSAQLLGFTPETESDALDEKSPTSKAFRAMRTIQRAANISLVDGYLERERFKSACSVHLALTYIQPLKNVDSNWVVISEENDVRPQAIRALLKIGRPSRYRF